MEERKVNILQLIPKYENYVEYEMQVYIKLPKIAKFNIGNRYIENVLLTLKDIYLIQKVRLEKRIDIVNEIDAFFSFQRSLLRVMYKLKYIDERKFNVSMRYLSEVGLILGGYIKSLGLYKNKLDSRKKL